MFNFIPRDEKYFHLFDQIGLTINEGAALIVTLFSDMSHANLHAEKMRNLERRCDDLAHSIIAKLNHSFITPIDREDIYALTSALRSVVDSTEIVSAHVIMYHIESSPELIRELATVYANVASELTAAVGKIASTHSKGSHFHHIRALASDADLVFRQAISDLFKEQSDLLSIIKWKDIYEMLASSIKKCLDAANILEAILLKHA